MIRVPSCRDSLALHDIPAVAVALAFIGTKHESKATLSKNLFIVNTLRSLKFEVQLTNPHSRMPHHERDALF
jgi:hypothetical protein